MDSQTFRCRRRKLQTGKGSVIDPGADRRVHQPPPGRKAPPSPGALPSAPEAPGSDGFAGPSRLSHEGEWRPKDKSGGR